MCCTWLQNHKMSHSYRYRSRVADHGSTRTFGPGAEFMSSSCHRVHVESSSGSDFALSMLQQYPQVQGGGAPRTLTMLWGNRSAQRKMRSMVRAFSVEVSCKFLGGINCMTSLRIPHPPSLVKSFFSRLYSQAFCSSHMRHTKRPGAAHLGAVGLLVLPVGTYSQTHVPSQSSFLRDSPFLADSLLGIARGGSV